MSIDSKQRPSLSLHCKGLAVAVAAMMTVGFGSASMVRAQDASPSPTAECDAPAFVPGGATPTSMEGMATPVPGVTVTPTPAPVGTPAEGDTADAIVAAANNLIACINGNTEGAVALMTDDFLVSQFGNNSHDDAVQMVQGFKIGNPTVSDPMTYDDGSVSVKIAFHPTEYQLEGDVWHLVQDGEYWKINALTHFTPDFEGDAAAVGVHLSETKNADGSYTYAITPNTAELVTPEVLVLHGINDGTMAHEIAVLKLPEGAKPEDIFNGKLKQSDVEFIGEIAYQPGEEADVVLEGLKPGTYTLACFFTGPDGKPHAADGMVTQITLDPAS